MTYLGKTFRMMPEGLTTIFHSNLGRVVHLLDSNFILQNFNLAPSTNGTTGCCILYAKVLQSHTLFGRPFLALSLPGSSRGNHSISQSSCKTEIVGNLPNKALSN